MTVRPRTVLAVVVASATVATPVALAATRQIEADATVRTTARDGATFTQEGPVTVKPFGGGTLVARTTLTRRTMSVTFTVRIKRSTIRGTAQGDVDFSLTRGATYRGTAKITGGTGRFRRARGRNLTFSGSAPISGDRATVRLTGTLRY